MPPAIEDLENDLQAEMDSDQDAEGEEETDHLYQMDAQLQDAVHRAYSGEIAEETENHSGGNNKQPEDAHADGEVDGHANAGGGKIVGAVKVPGDADSSYNGDVASDENDADEDPAFEGDTGSASSESEADGEDWEAESNGNRDGEGDNTGTGNCMWVTFRHGTYHVLMTTGSADKMRSTIQARSLKNT